MATCQIDLALRRLDSLPDGTVATSPSTSRACPDSILVVEDDAGIRELLRWLLEEEGFSVEVAADGEEAIVAALQHKPSLVLLDINLPLRDGYQVADALKASFSGPPMIVVITASSLPAQAASRVGAVAYLSKPFAVDDVIATVRRALGHRFVA